MLTVKRTLELTKELDGFLQLQLGERHAYVCVLWNPKDGKLAVLTNRESTREIVLALATACQTAEQAPASAWNETDIDAD